MKITILGSGTPAPSLKRACSGYMIEVGDDVIIMDHGPDAHRRLIESGKRADFAVLEDDPYEVDPNNVKDIRVWGTVQGGRVFPASDL